MTNTQLRIFSAAIMLTIIAICLFLHNSFAIGLIGIAGLTATDELLSNFSKISRKSINYWISILTFFIGYIYLNFINQGLYDLFILLGLLVNLLGIINLFYASKRITRIVYKLFDKYSFVIGLMTLSLFMNIASILNQEKWQLLIIGAIILNYSVDTFAWVFGRIFGKRKLMPSVSPKKTVEGVVGGAACSFILINIYWYALFGALPITLVIGFLFLSCTSQIGDLIQSKLKRQFRIKDSSGIIPGHGGVYDRFDSLLYVAPQFLLLIKYFAN